MNEHVTTVEFYEGGVVYITLCAVPTREDLKSNFLGPLNAMLDAEKTFSVIVDSTRVVSANMTLVTTVMSWLRSNRERFKHFLRCTSIITRGSLIRNILDMIFRVQTPVAPMKVVHTDPEAWDFVHSVESNIREASALVREELSKSVDEPDSGDESTAEDDD
jgi:hypothetical protein